MKLKTVKMLIALLPLIFAMVAADHQLEPSATQLPDFKEMTDCPIGVLTTAAGAPVDYRDTHLLNSNIINNEFFMDEMQLAVRERRPERMVHASGVGAFGYFEVTHDVSQFCKAKLFSKVGKKTPVAVRFSLSAPSIGAPDTSQGSRGFAVKFYTEEGNFDLLGTLFPVFSIKDPVKALAVLRIAKKNPATHLPDPNMFWDFLTLNPEAIHVNMYSFSDRGAPAGYMHMTGNSIHTYQFYNERGESFYGRTQMVPCDGPIYLNATEARKVATGDPDFYAKGLYNTIAKGKFPCYDLKIQFLSDEDRKNADMDIFDITKVMDEIRYPFKKVGRMILNKNVQNHFTEIDSLAFCPGNLVPGILGSPDIMFQSRRLIYRDAQIHRLGSNFKNILVNYPIQSQVLNYIRDGVPPYYPNVRNGPNYYPNSFNGPVPIVEKNRPELLKIHEKPPNNFEQAGHFYSKVLSPSQRTTLINNMINGLCTCTDIIKNRAVKYFKIIHREFGNRVAEGLAAKCA